MKPSVTSPSLWRTSPSLWRRWSCVWLALPLLPILGAGCAGTFHEVHALSPAKPPPEPPTALVIGHVEIADARVPATEKELYRLKFQQGIETWFSKTNVFESILNGTNTPPHSVVLTGTINEVEPGSAAARFWVGMGAGQSRVQGQFDLKDPADQSLARFSARRSYLGGTGAGGADMLNMDELVFRLGQTVGETIQKWRNGQKLD